MNARVLLPLALLTTSTLTACAWRVSPPATPEETGPASRLWRRSAAAGDFARFTREGTTLAGDGVLELEASAPTGTEPLPAGASDGGTLSLDTSYRVGTAVSDEQLLPEGFDSVIPSFDVTTPPGTWVRVTVAARVEGQWTKDYDFGVWALERDTVARQSVNGQEDAHGNVYTDTLALKKKADALRLKVWLYSTRPEASPRVRALSAAVTNTRRKAEDGPAERTAWGTKLEVPGYSQMLYPEGGPVWCSPTSTTMLLGYWSQKLGRPELVETVPAAAAHTYDTVYQGTGNWSFNTAYASAMAGGALHGLVARFDSFAQVEQLVASGIPVSISIAYDEGKLTGSPVRSSDGHLIVVKGFTPQGDVICNDPAFRSNEAVEVTYKREELWRAWRHSRGAAYVLWPSGTALPAALQATLVSNLTP